MAGASSTTAAEAAAVGTCPVILQVSEGFDMFSPSST